MSETVNGGTAATGAADATTTGLAPVFARAREEGRAAFIGYFPAGYPTVEESVASITAIAEAGADVIEVGVPYSDPMMDGPVIQEAADVALANGFRVHRVFEVIRRATDAGATCVTMTYWNVVLQYGPERFARDLAAAGGRGAIIPDLIPEEAGRWREAAAANGLDAVFLVAPSTTPERMHLTCDAASGFVYASSHMGVTGARASVDSAAGELVARVREATDTPVAVGLGVSTGEQAAEIAAFADGVIVGSALIRAAEEGPGALSRLSSELADGCRRGRGEDGDR